MAELGFFRQADADPARIALVGPDGTEISAGALAAPVGAAFDAARYAIEELKARAPIWKSERMRIRLAVWLPEPLTVAA